MDHVEKALIFLSVFLMMALNWYYIYWVNEVIDDWDDDDTTPYDYALMIQHLPTDTENVGCSLLACYWVFSCNSL